MISTLYRLEVYEPKPERAKVHIRERQTILFLLNELKIIWIDWRTSDE